MSKLEKARIQEVSADKNETPKGDPMVVQFNPSSLKLKLTNTTAGGRSRTSQSRQHVGAGATVLTTELIFDTADEGSEYAPISVRSKTRELEKYVLPKKGKEKPPRLRFEWDELMVAGTVESLDIDFDLFASNGAPLRAKVSLSIKSQEAKYMLGQAGVAMRTTKKASKPGAPAPGKNDSNGSKPGSSGTGGGGSDRSATALEGESPAEFAARQGLDPQAWRALDVDMLDGLSLPTGIEVGFNEAMSFSTGLGASVGVSAGIGLSLEAAVGLELSAQAGASFSAGMSATAAAGFALSAAGGVEAAVETVKISRAQGSVQQTQQAFSSHMSTQFSASAAVAVTGMESAASSVAAYSVQQQQGQKRTPLMSHAGSRPGPREKPVSAPPPPRVDARADSYGQGVPLRERYQVDVTQQVVTVYGDKSDKRGAR